MKPVPTQDEELLPEPRRTPSLVEVHEQAAAVVGRLRSRPNGAQQVCRQPTLAIGRLGATHAGLQHHRSPACDGSRITDRKKT
jgi:hypothetical protein